MYKLFLFFLLGLTSCKTCYQEVWCVEKYPMEWSDTIIKPKDHWHFKDQNNEWTCVDIDEDTIYLNVQDTMYIEKLDWVFLTKEKKKL